MLRISQRECSMMVFGSSTRDVLFWLARPWIPAEPPILAQTVPFGHRPPGRRRWTLKAAAGTLLAAGARPRAWERTRRISCHASATLAAEGHVWPRRSHGATRQVREAPARAAWHPLQAVRRRARPARLRQRVAGGLEDVARALEDDRERVPARPDQQEGA